MSNEIPYGYCQCGCGEETAIATRTKSKRGQHKGEPLAFRRGHSGRRGASLGIKAFYISEGRTYVMARKGGGGVLYSRVLMWNHIGRKPRPDEIIHHINEDPTDDRIENLQIVTRAGHINLHRASIAPSQREGSRKLRRRVTAICKGCGNPYERTPSEMRINGGYCSPGCTSEDRRLGIIDNGRRRAAA
jgi:HNH endonuclease